MKFNGYCYHGHHLNLMKERKAMPYLATPIETINIVVRSGKDAYHFAKMRNKFEEEQIIIGFYQDIKRENVELPHTEAMKQACIEVEILDRLARGKGRSQRVRESLKNRKTKNINHIHAQFKS